MGERAILVLGLPVTEQIKNKKASIRNELKRKLECVISEEKLGASPTKKQALNVHTDDICSGVSDLAIVQDENASNILDFSSIPNLDDLSGTSNQVNSGEITVESSGSSCAVSCSDEMMSRSHDGFSRVCTVTREVSSPASTAGVRKITIKIRKKSQDYDSNHSIDDERLGVQGGALPSKCVGKTLKQQPSSLINGPKQPSSLINGPKQPSSLINGPKQQPSSLINGPKQQPSSLINGPQQPSSSINGPKQQPSSSINGPKQPSSLINGLKQPSSLINGPKQQPSSFINGLEQHPAIFISVPKKKRNDDLHRSLFEPSGLPDGTNLAYCIRGEKILEGYKQGNGILCSHCSDVISPSQFEAHAGMATRKKPYQHIYTADGITLHDIAISLDSEQKQTYLKNNEDNKSIMMRMRRPVKKSKVDTSGTCAVCLEHDFSVNIFDDRTVVICDQCEKEYHVGCLREFGHCDLKELPKDKWFCCHDCDRISDALTDRVAKGSEVISSTESCIINTKLQEKGLREVADEDVQLRLLSGKYCLLEHQPLLSKAVSVFRECFSPITTPNGRDLTPLMVRGRCISGQDFRGMYSVILTVKSAVVSVGLVRILGSEVAELPLVATRKRYQGKGYFLALFLYIEKFLCSLKVEKLVLPAAEYAIPMWVNRFGFGVMSQENICMYTKVFQLTEFNGTIMMEKQLQKMD